MRFGVVVFPGTWSDCDFHYVVSEVLHQPVRYVWHRERELRDLDCVILPGGFSYGDYLRAGAVAGRSPVTRGLRPGQVLTMPISHGEGKYYADAETLARLKRQNLVVFRYAEADGRVTKQSNPNGSLDNIAGIVNPEGTVLGMMPHPERASEAPMGGTDGLLMFQSLLGSLVEDGSFLKR